MDQRCDSGGAKKGGAAFLVLQALRLEQRAEPTPWVVLSACRDCPYRACGFPLSGLELALEQTLAEMAQERYQGMLPPW